MRTVIFMVLRDSGDSGDIILTLGASSGRPLFFQKKDCGPFTFPSTSQTVRCRITPRRYAGQSSASPSPFPLTTTLDVLAMGKQVLDRLPGSQEQITTTSPTLARYRRRRARDFALGLDAVSQSSAPGVAHHASLSSPAQITASSLLPNAYDAGSGPGHSALPARYLGT